MIRQSAVAGQFYPENKNQLIETILDFLKNVYPDQPKDQTIIGLLSPHAGYQFSGQIAAWGYKLLLNKKIDKVILIGQSHHQSFNSAIIDGCDYWQTPLGEIPVDINLRNQLIKSSNFKINSEVHRIEHSLEVQLPFLQATIKSEFKILPILVGDDFPAEAQIIAHQLSQIIIQNNAIFIISSDLSHYPDYYQADLSDHKILKSISSGSVEKFQETVAEINQNNIPNLLTPACGQGAIKIGLHLANSVKVNSIKILQSANSGDFGSGKDKVVGYGSVGFFKERRDNLLNYQEQKTILDIATEVIESYANTGIMPDFQRFQPKEEVLNQKRGIFVTIKENSHLRGCIGTIEPIYPIWLGVAKMALSAAFQDPRFNPVSVDELDNLEYEISILSPCQKIDNWHIIELGKDGVIVSGQGKSGVFLPQVAEETGWDLETFLNHLCIDKAGLPADSWKNGIANLYIFQVQKFSSAHSSVGRATAF